MKRRQELSVNIGSFEVTIKKTIWRKSNYFNFVGWVIQLLRIETFQTVLIFLPLIPYSITKFSTVR